MVLFDINRARNVHRGGGGGGAGGGAVRLADMACKFCLLALGAASVARSVVDAAPTFDIMRDFDSEKLQTVKWWVTHRAQRLRKGHLDRCLAVSFTRRFSNHQLYIEIDHENSGAIDQAYYPATLDSTGFTFKMKDDETARVDVIDTDYATYFIGYMSLKKRQTEFLFAWANVPKPEGDLLAKISSRLLEITGVGIDALEPVDNDNCPERAD